jgi:hypothetical protein
LREPHRRPTIAAHHHSWRISHEADASLPIDGCRSRLDRLAGCGGRRRGGRRSARQTAVAGPTLTRAEMAEFLRAAEVVSSKPLSTGVTKPWRLTLAAGGVTHDAVFQSVDQKTAVQRMANGRTELNFRDSYHFNIAAYKLAAVLGLDHMVPVTVERTWDKRTGSLSWWIDWKWDETSRRKEDLRPPDAVDWAMQQNRMRVFSELVHDTDRNTGNQLITEDWRLWMVDFTRAFRLSNGLFREQNVQRCSRDLLAAMKALTAESVAAATDPHLVPGEIKALLKRRDRIVERIEMLVQERGEQVVLY